MVLRPTRSTRTVTLFPYTTLCRAPELEDILRIAMPDVEWCEWEPRHLKGASAPKIKKVVKRIVAYLQALPPETLKISSRALKKERSEEHTSELQSLIRISYAVFFFKKQKLLLFFTFYISIYE